MPARDLVLGRSHPLEVTCAAVGYLKTFRVDQGSEFISRDLDLWV